MTIGDKIPEVLGYDQDGREIKASDYRGRKIVLYSYPKANTSDVLPKLALCKLIRRNWLLQDMTLSALAKINKLCKRNLRMLTTCNFR